MSKTFYIAGPMRGFPYFNFPFFDEARDAVINLGFQAISPADIDRANGMTDDLLPSTPKEEEEFLKKVNVRVVAKCDVLAIIDKCDGMVLLPEWHNSKGARAEYALAEWLGLEIVYAWRRPIDGGVIFLKENPEINIWKQNPDILQENI